MSSLGAHTKKVGHPKTQDDWSSYPVVPDFSEEALRKRVFGNDSSKKNGTLLSKEDQEKKMKVANDLWANYRKKLDKWKQDHPNLADECPKWFF